MKGSLVAMLACATLAFGCGDDEMPTSGDMATVSDAGLDGGGGAGAIGSECKSTADCKEGTAPVCWIARLFNKTGNLGTKNGYCSSTCDTDADCGAAGNCVSFGTSGKACIATCMAPTDCRSGYACFNFGCFPNGNLSCDPTEGDGSCMADDGSGNSVPGGCIRQALGPGTTGECEPQCTIGKNTCADVQTFKRQCVVVDQRKDVDGTATMDTWVGPVCSFTATDPDPPATGAECLYPSADGMMTHFLDACEDGSECYLKGMNPAGMGFDAAGDNICRPLCYLPGGMPAGGPDAGTIATACAAPTPNCKDIWGLAAAASPSHRIGLCTP